MAKYRSAVRTTPDDAEARNCLGIALLHSDDQMGAEIQFADALQINPDSAHLHNNLGVMMLFLGPELELAIDEFRTAIRLDPGYPEAHTNLADAVAPMAGGLDEAIAEYRTVLQIEPDSIEVAHAHANLGTLLFRKEDVEGAIAEYRAALDLVPTHGQANHNLRLALETTGDLHSVVVQYSPAFRVSTQRRLKNI